MRKLWKRRREVKGSGEQNPEQRFGVTDPLTTPWSDRSFATGVVSGAVAPDRPLRRRASANAIKASKNKRESIIIANRSSSLVFFQKSIEYERCFYDLSCNSNLYLALYPLFSLRSCSAPPGAVLQQPWSDSL